MGRPGILGLAGAMAASLASCAINDPLALDRAGVPQNLETIELVASEDDGALRSQFREAVVDAFGRRGIGIAEGSKAVADLAISLRSAETAIIPGAQSQTQESTGPIKSDGREGKWFESCDGERLRATLAVFDRSSGALNYRGSVQSDQCRGKPVPVAVLAERLVGDALGEVATETSE
ncbi:hypothetical protein P7228_13880 [Altererythrobacter arenosus]|uniref:DUF4136 domain-containing protein n=1 Tax=Altererythrobacter arenosus TaxID=3032592 RepID=A0ABY8FPW9_9SPHN|nr:hypothetical protein [Altererythrobacter sp. CAU 1644]WFL77067.1 hypothetical protein P7228_13880 [Altererythrobacter sp. CAU 1644]